MPIGFLKPGTRACRKCGNDLAGLAINRIHCDACERCFVDGCSRPSSAGWCPMHRLRHYNRRKRGRGNLGGAESIRVVGVRVACFRCGGEAFGKSGRPLCVVCRRRSSIARDLRKSFGIGLETYEQLLELQDNKCAICGRTPRSRRLAVDHDHTTNAIRGLLCSQCNKDLLGAARDSADILRSAVSYLESPPAAHLEIIADGVLTRRRRPKEESS